MNINEIVNYYTQRLGISLLVDKIAAPSLKFYNNIDKKSQFFDNLVRIDRYLHTLITVLEVLHRKLSGLTVNEHIEKAKSHLKDAREEMKENKGRNRVNFRSAKENATEAKHIVLILPVQLALRKFCSTGIYKEPKV